MRRRSRLSPSDRPPDALIPASPDRKLSSTIVRRFLQTHALIGLDDLTAPLPDRAGAGHRVARTLGRHRPAGPP